MTDTRVPTDEAVADAPTVLVVGFPKAGSTALFNLLAQHPVLEPSVDKENWALYPSIWQGRPARPDELDAYLAAIPEADGRGGVEGAPANVFVHRDTVAALRDALPHAHVLAAVREPRDRLVSAFRFQRRRGLAMRRFRGFVRENLDGHDRGVRLQPGMASGFHVTSGLYGRALEPWVEVFGTRLGIVDASALHRDRAEQTLDQLAAWIGLAPFPRVRVHRWNVTPRRRGDRLRAALGRPIDHLPGSLEERLARLHDEDRDRLTALVETRPTGPVLGAGWLDLGGAT